MIELGRPVILLTVPGLPTAQTFSSISWTPQTSHHLRLYFRVSEDPSVTRFWLLPRPLLSAVIGSALTANEVACVPPSLALCEHPDNAALIRVTDAADGLIVDLDRASLAGALSLLDERAPMELAVDDQDLDAFLADVLSDTPAGIGFHVPVHLMGRIARPTPVQFLNTRLTGSVDQEVQCRFSRERRRPGTLAVEIQTGHMQLTLWLNITELGRATEEAMLREMGYALPEGGLPVSLDVAVTEVLDYDHLDRSTDGTDDDLRNAAIILGVSSALAPLGGFQLLLPEQALIYFRLLAKAWASEHASAVTSQAA